MVALFINFAFLVFTLGYEYQNQMLCMTSKNVNPVIWQIPENKEFRCNQLRPEDLEPPKRQKLLLFIRNYFKYKSVAFRCVKRVDGEKRTTGFLGTAHPAVKYM